MFDHAVINRKVIENSCLKLVFFLALAVACCSLAVHVRSAAQSPDCVEQCVCHCFTRWGKKTHRNGQKRTAFIITIQIPFVKTSPSALKKTNQSFRNRDVERRIHFQCVKLISVSISRSKKLISASMSAKPTSKHSFLLDRKLFVFVIYWEWKGSHWTYLPLWKQSRGFSWGRNRCCGGTSGIWNHSGTCWSHRCRNTCPAGCSTWSWLGFPCPSDPWAISVSNGSRNKTLRFFFFLNLCLIVPLLEQADQRSRNCIHQALASGSQGEEQEVFLWIAKQNIRYSHRAAASTHHLDSKLHPDLSPKGHLWFLGDAGVGQGPWKWTVNSVLGYLQHDNRYEKESSVLLWGHEWKSFIFQKTWHHVGH